MDLYQGLNENERAIILKMQEDIISIAEIKFSGNKSKDEYTKKNLNVIWLIHT